MKAVIRVTEVTSAINYRQG